MSNENYPEHRYWIEYRAGEDSKVLGLVLGLKAAVSTAKVFELLDPKYKGTIHFERCYNEVQ